MKNQKIAFVVLIVVLSLFLFLSQTSSPKTERWEYKTIHNNDLPTSSSTIQEFNKLGAEGWELVSVIINGRSCIYFFKRKL